jgi:phage terminase large subunit
MVDRLREQGYQVRGINVARASRQSNLFANFRADGYWRLRELFAAGQISIPNDNQLMGELAALRYSYDSQGRIIMESKEDMRQRGLPSPDRADALMLAFLELSARARLWT